MLIDRAAEGSELSYMQRIALEHAQLTSRITAETAENLIGTLVENFRLSKKGSITLANFIPNSIDEIKVLLGKEAGNFEQETFDEMLKLLLSVELLDEKERKMDIEEIEEEAASAEDKEIDESMIPEDLR